MAPHEHLGIADDASLDAAHERFRALAGVLHPQAGGDPGEFARLREAYETFVADRCAALGVAAEPELALARQDPFAVSAAAAGGVSSIGQEVLAGVQALGAYAADTAEHATNRSLFGSYAPFEPTRAELDPTPMAFGGYVLSALAAWAVALVALSCRHPQIDGRLLALHGVVYLLALALVPALVALVAAQTDGRNARNTWIGATLGLGLLFAALPPQPFLAKACANQPVPIVAADDE